MHSKITNFLAIAMFALTSASAYAASAVNINLPDAAVTQTTVDDETPEVTARVARVSFIIGQAQIRRADAVDWENLTLNLPIVEGDEITTSENSKVEIQLDNDTHIRMDGLSYFKFTTLSDEGVAGSLSQGTVSARLNSLDPNASYFEIDAPGSTIAAEKPGVYRIDAAKGDSNAIRVAVSEDGEARVYTQSAGFTVKNGRSAHIFVDGSNEGDWDSGDLAKFTDGFDTWALERDAAIAKSLQTAHYDKYYDRDMYGADDLDAYGDWVYTKKYGYVWKPFGSATRPYSDWSPYRYGQWRWVPPYGWTWVNDEPWGWATYHHGRWIWDDGYWAWTPYGEIRYARSWWFPALVVVSIFNSNVCWYPLPYSYGYYNYNSYWYSNGGGWRNGRGHGNHGPGGNGGHGGHGGGHGPTPTPTPSGGGSGDIGPGLYKGPKKPPLGDVPPGGVVSIPQGDFGRIIKGVKKAPLDDANAILKKVPNDRELAPRLPAMSDVSSRLPKDIRAEKPKIATVAEGRLKTGAAPRSDTALDKQLRSTRIYGDRSPAKDPPVNSPGRRSPEAGQRKLGAVERPDIKPRDTSPRSTGDTPKVKVQPQDKGVFQPKPQPPVRETRPDTTPRQQPKYDPPAPRPQPRPSPPQRPQPQPRNDSPKRSSPPPQKSAPSSQGKESRGGRKG